MSNLTRILITSTLVSLITLLAVVGATTQAYVYVPSNTPSTGGANAWPFSSWPNWRYQILIPAYSLPNATFKVSQIAFAGGNTSVFTSPDFQIRIAHKTLNTLNANFASNFDHPPIVCYDGAINYNITKDTWSPIGLMNQFAYDGVRNVVIEIRYRGGSSGFSLIQHGGTTRAYVNSGSDPYTATFATSFGGGPKVRLNKILTGIVSTPFTVATGGTLPIDIVCDLISGGKYQVVNAFGQGTLPLGANLHLNLANDPLLWTSLFLGPPLFNNYAGPVSQRQPIRASLNVPDISALAGIDIYTAGLTYNNHHILEVTNTSATTIVRKR